MCAKVIWYLIVLYVERHCRFLWFSVSSMLHMYVYSTHVKSLACGGDIFWIYITYSTMLHVTWWCYIDVMYLCAWKDMILLFALLFRHKKTALDVFFEKQQQQYLSSDENLGQLLSKRDYTTQLYKDYKKSLQRSAWNQSGFNGIFHTTRKVQQTVRPWVKMDGF